jgi:hypothetical protein
MKSLVLTSLVLFTTIANAFGNQLESLDARSAQATLVCTTDQIIPRDGVPRIDNEYLNQCFLMSEHMELNFDDRSFRLSGTYFRQHCGWHTPIFSSIEGIIRQVGIDHFELIGGTEQSLQNFQAEIHVSQWGINLKGTTTTIAMRCF